LGSPAITATLYAPIPNLSSLYGADLSFWGFTGGPQAELVRIRPRYRAPELLLGAKEYSWEIDMWAVGCIFAEMLIKEPLIKAQTEIQMIDQIFKMLGTPNDDVWPGFSELPFVKKMKFKVPFSIHKNEMALT